MKMKKTIAMLMAGTMLAGSIPASALYSENVSHDAWFSKYVWQDSSEEGFFNNSTLYTIEDPDGEVSSQFTIDGRKFSILDTDEEGNYFVIADESYGYRTWLTDASIMPDDTTIMKAIGNDTDGYQIEYVDPKFDYSKIFFNPEQDGNIGKWLNEDFLVSGNGGKKLPTDIVNNLVEKTYEIRPRLLNADLMPKTPAAALALRTEGYEWSKANPIPKSSFTAKVSFISKAELLAYKDKIVAQDYSETPIWQGFMTRDVMGITKFNADNNTAYMELSPFDIRFYTNGEVKGATITPVYTSTGNPHFVRPCFWLDKDFFKNVKIDITNIGSDPLAEVKKYDYYDLAMAGYTDEEIESLGIELGIGRPKELIDPMAGYGNYPEFKANTIAYNNPSWEASARDKYHFSVAVDDVTTKNFVLLDRDANGNYLVLAEDNYGAYKFYDCAEADELNSYDFTADDWNYDPARENSVAYYLDNDFLTTGYGQNMPESVKENILGVKAGTTKPTWKVENHRIYGKPTYATEGINKTKYEQWLAGNNDDIREFQSSVVLPSYTEVMTYSDKIMVNYTDWKGPMTRTTFYNIQTDTENGVDKIHARFWRMNTHPTSGKNQLCVDGEADLNTGATYSVRPMFWLDKDFFKNEKVVATDIGSEVAKQIMQYNIADMDDLYTAAELEAIGYTNLPTITTPSIKGNVVAGQPLNVSYEFSSPVEGATQKGTKIQWYIADDAEGPWTAIEGATDVEYIIKDTDLDKYVKVEVIPMDILNNIGARSESEVKLLTEASLFEVNSEVYFYDADGNDLTTLNGATYIEAEFGIINANPAAVTKTFIIAVYDKDGNMIKMNTVDQSVATNTREDYYVVSVELDAALGADCTCKAMIWDTMDSMVPVAMGEFVPAV